MTGKVEKTGRLVLMIGMSGSGLSTAGDAFEDIGFETVDNVPFRFVPDLVQTCEHGRDLVIVLDVRNRDFGEGAFLSLVAELRVKRADVQILFLECREDVILHRYSSTKRRHPFADQKSIQDAIAHEGEMLLPIRSAADVLLQTSDLNPHELKFEIERLFAIGGEHHTDVQIHSFAYGRGLPRTADFVFDCRFLRNPHWEPALRPLYGTDHQVKSYVEADSKFDEFFQRIMDCVLLVLPAAKVEGKSYLNIAFGCTGGRHRSVAIAESVAAALAKEGWQVSTKHRELFRLTEQGAEE